MLNVRQAEIVEIARSEGRVAVEDLARRFDVTLQTIRRDLAGLDAAGKLERVHGGAVLPSGVANIEYEARRRLAAEAKDRIGRACAARIPNDSSLFLNIGTTTEAVARALLVHRNLMVVTNNINVANILIANPSCEIVVAGGTLRRSDGGLVGDATIDIVSQFKLDFAIVGASALDTDGDLLDFDVREVRVSQAILRQARKALLVADGTKFQRKAPVRIGSMAAVDCLITDSPPPQRVRTLCRGWNTEIEIAG